jgi:hypothetical protein
MTRRSEKRRQTRPIGKGRAHRSNVTLQPASTSAADGRTRVLWMCVAASALALLLTIDDRYAGAIADGRQMAWTAVAIAETGEIGQARGRDFTWSRTAGDAVSRYGMGMSLVQVPAAWLAPAVESAQGPGASQPLFLIVPFLCVCVSAALAGWIALNLDLGKAGIAAAVLLTSIGSPLGSYAALDLSEPLQAVSLSLAVASAVASTNPSLERRRAMFYAMLAGFGAGVAVLTKSSLWLAVPFALLPLLGRGGSTSLRARLALMLTGLLGPIVAWVGFDLVRFGQLFASYPGERFSHSFIDGAWRLFVGPNRGFLIYFPALGVAMVTVAIYSRRQLSRTRLAALAAIGIFGALLALASGWWAWHGLWGWGPRLLVPSIPPLAASAAVVLDTWIGPARIAMIVGSVLLNVPGLLQNAAPVTMFTSACEWPKADARFAESLATYARRKGPDGEYRIAPDQVLEMLPQASPFVVYPWFAAATWTRVVDDAARWLQTPPWIGVRPDISCGRSGWPVWGRAFWPDPNAPGFPGVYGEGLLDQVVRAQQLGRGERALALAHKLARVAPDGEAHAQVLESLRILRRRAEAGQYLSSLSPAQRSQPKINVVLALFERDSNNEALARNLLASVASSFRGTPVERSLSAPLSSWPSDLNSMTTTPVDQAGGVPTTSLNR